MRSRRAIAGACALTMLLGVATSGIATARTGVSHFAVVGPGVQALWEGAWDGQHAIATNFLAFQQLNAPGTRGYFHEVVIIRTAFNGDGKIDWEAVYDTYGAADPTIVIDQPLEYASISGTAPLVGCDGACPVLPDEVSFEETWIGTGTITRIAAPKSDEPYFVLAPGVLLDMNRGVEFTRTATLGISDPFDGAFGPLGTLSTSDPGVRFLDVHLAFVTVCHPGAC